MGTHFNGKNMNNVKQHLKLDFNIAKKENLHIPLLSSPDLNMLKVNTPDLEKMILTNGLPINMSTPSTAVPVSYHRAVTEEQESFATGFVDALQNLHNNSNSNQASDNSSSIVYTDLEQQGMPFMPVIKDEPQMVPNVSVSPPMSPVNMEHQERIKLERKRQRNRVAATKCRWRKLEQISKLEDKVKNLKNENGDLDSILNQLKEHVGLLKVEVMNHMNAGCQIMM